MAQEQTAIRERQKTSLKFLNIFCNLSDKLSNAKAIPPNNYLIFPELSFLFQKYFSDLYHCLLTDRFFSHLP